MKEIKKEASYLEEAEAGFMVLQNYNLKFMDLVNVISDSSLGYFINEPPENIDILNYRTENFWKGCVTHQERDLFLKCSPHLTEIGNIKEILRNHSPGELKVLYQFQWVLDVVYIDMHVDIETALKIARVIIFNHQKQTKKRK